MICISQKLSQLLQASCTKAFNFPQMGVNVIPTAIDSEYDYISSISKDLFEKHREEMSKYWRQDQLFATGIAQELYIQMESNPYVKQCNVDSLGQLNISIRDSNYIAAIQTIVKHNTHSTLTIDYHTNPQHKHAVIFPFSQIAEKPLLNTFRGANLAESMARLQNTLGVDVTRVAVIQNNQPFHGIIYAYLKQSKAETGKVDESGLNFEKLAQFIISKELFTQEDVAAFGAQQIKDMQASSEDTSLKEIMEQLTNAAIGNFQETYSKFTPLNIKLVRGDQIESSTYKYLESLRKKGTLNNQNGNLMTYSQNQNIALVDPVGSLTREGFLLGLLRNLHLEDFIKEFHISSDIHDELLYKNIQSMMNSCNIDGNLHFYGHNNLFSEQTDKNQINTLQELFTQMKQMNIVKYKQKYPDIMPNLLEQQGELFLDQCLGWTRYLDHRKSRKTPYLMSTENVIDFIHSNEKLTNTRQNLLEMLDSYNIRREGIAPISNLFTFENSKERNLAKVLLYFPDALHKTLNSNDFKHLIEYSELLFSVIDYMQRENIFKKFDAADKLTERQIANRVVLLDATNKIIHKLFYIIGILNA